MRPVGPGICHETAPDLELMADSWTPHHPRRRAAAVGAVLLLTACSPAPTLDDALSTVHSWTATATLAAAHERAGVLSHRLAAQLHGRGSEAHREQRQSLDTLAHSADDRRRAQAALDSLDRALRHLGPQAAER